MDNLTGSIDLQVRYHLCDNCTCSRYVFHSFRRQKEGKETALQIERVEDPKLLVIVSKLEYSWSLRKIYPTKTNILPRMTLYAT